MNKSDDTISRQDAIEQFCEFGTSLESQGKTMITMVDAKYAFIKTLESLPSAEPKTGTWHREIEGNGWNEWLKITCSECERIYIDLYPRNFCPNCGAKMLGEDGE